jgi:uncharacterized oxidoreductase
VVICGRDTARLDAACTTVPGLAAIRCDVTDADDVGTALAEIARRFGRLDVLVNNAGMQCNYQIAGEPAIRDRVAREIARNLTALVMVTHASLPLSRRSSEAVVVNVGSGTALVPKADGVVDSATKAAVRSFTMGPRWELEPDQIRVTELVPPWSPPR